MRRCLQRGGITVQHVNLDEDDYTFGGEIYNSGDADFGVIRAGLNYRF